MAMNERGEGINDISIMTICNLLCAPQGKIHVVYHKQVYYSYTYTYEDHFSKYLLLSHKLCAV
jgi:hypothetical protein